MIEFLIAHLPPDVSLQTAALLVATGLATSMITAAFGLGGGMGMLAVMANVLPVVAVIPVHGGVQFGNNFIRAVIHRRHIDWKIAFWFTIGAVIGGAIGINVVVAMSKPMLQFTLGLFVMYSALMPQDFRKPFGRVGQILSGVATTFVTLFVGATGPLVGALLPRQHMTRLELLGTHGALLTVQQGLKITLFSIVGFAYLSWIWLLAIIFLVGIVGNLLGVVLLKRVSEHHFRRIFQALLILLALRLIAVAVLEWV